MSPKSPVHLKTRNLAAWTGSSPVNTPPAVGRVHILSEPEASELEASSLSGIFRMRLRSVQRPTPTKSTLSLNGGGSLPCSGDSGVQWGVTGDMSGDGGFESAS